MSVHDDWPHVMKCGGDEILLDIEMEPVVCREEAVKDPTQLSLAG